MNCPSINRQPAAIVMATAVCLVVNLAVLLGQEPSGGSVAVVGHVKVLTQHVPDVSSIDAWKKSFIRDEMSPREKALSVFKTKVMFSHQDPPPLEYLQEAPCVHDPIKSFNVYGYGMCCCASSNVEALARHVGLPARGWAINAHSVSEVQWNDAWHLLDASLINYFPKEDGKLASVKEIEAAVSEWYEKHPGFKGDSGKLDRFQRENGWSGWRNGPALIARSPFFDASGFWPAKTHGWNSTMMEYDGRGGTPFIFEYGYSQGYEVNIQLRPGERLTRNWFHNGLHVNGIGNDGNAPGCLNEKIADGDRLRVSLYHTVIVHDGQVCASLIADEVFSLLRREVELIDEYFKPKRYFMSHDEIRVAGWDELAQGRPAGKLLAGNVRRCGKLIHEIRPDAEVLVWSDMFDPNHNARDNYYLVHGTLAGSWDGLDPSVGIINWNGGKAQPSLMFFADRRHQQIIAGYYDGDVARNFEKWKRAASGIKGVNGYMYTTWRQNYDALEAFADRVRSGAR